MEKMNRLPVILLGCLLALAACDATATPTLSPAQATPTPLPSPTEPAPTAAPTEMPTAAPEPTAEITEEPEAAPTESAAGDASLGGQVWHDICATRRDAGGAITDAGPGCVVVEGSYRGNGAKEPKDPGLAGLTVSLSRDSCAEASSASAVTDQDGRFGFSELIAGTYCVRLEPSAGSNAELLGEGLWTTGADAGNGFTLELAEGEQRADLSFGWDFDDFPPLSSFDCSEKVAFVKDVTIPDNTLFRPGETFQKTWRVKNDGDCTWDSNYQLIFVNGASFGAEQSFAFPSVVSPGGVVDLSVEMQAPSGGGTYTSNWQFRNPDGRQFGVGLPATGYLWALIKVTYVDAEGNSAPPPEPGESAAGSQDCPVSVDAGVESQVLALLNTERSAALLPALTSNAQLTEAARAHSTDMSCNDFIDHTGSDGSLWYGRIARQGYDYAYAAENIYVGNPAFGGTAEGAMDWWMNSQVHRDNILSKAISEIGIGYVYNENSTYGGYFTVVFARP